MSTIFHFLRSVPVSSAFLFLCLGLYLVMIATGAHFANPHNRALIEWGGNYRVLTLEHQSWRLLTSLFVHGGLAHVLVNGISILDLAAMLEQRIGSWRLLLVLLISGICGGLAALVWGPLSVVVGASGALMGAAGTLLVWFAMPDDKQHRNSMFLHLLCLVVAALVFGAIWSRMNNAAHIGGLVAGLVLGPILWLSREWRSSAQIWLALALLLLTMALTTYTLRQQRSDEYRFRATLPEVNAILQQNRHPQWLALPNRAPTRPAAGTAVSSAASTAVSSAAGASGQSPTLESTQPSATGQAGWQRCLQLAQGWKNMRLLPRQELLAQQITNLCRLQQQQQLWLAQARQTDKMQQLILHPQFIQLQGQITNLYQNITPTLGAELEIEYSIEQQIAPAARASNK